MSTKVRKKSEYLVYNARIPLTQTPYWFPRERKKKHLMNTGGKRSALYTLAGARTCVRVYIFLPAACLFLIPRSFTYRRCGVQTGCGRISDTLIGFLSPYIPLSSSSSSSRQSFAFLTSPRGNPYPITLSQAPSTSPAPLHREIEDEMPRARLQVSPRSLALSPSRISRARLLLLLSLCLYVCLSVSRAACVRARRGSLSRSLARLTSTLTLDVRASSRRASKCA